MKKSFVWCLMHTKILYMVHGSNYLFIFSSQGGKGKKTNKLLDDNSFELKAE